MSSMEPHSTGDAAPSVPPTDPETIRRYLDRGRQLRAQTMNRALRGAAAGLLSVARRAADLVRGVADLVGRPASVGDRLARIPLTGHRR